MATYPGVTDPTGGAPNFDIAAMLQSYGIEPTQAMVSALAPAFEGRTNVGQTGSAAVGNFVFALQKMQGAEKLVQGQLLDEQTAETNARNLGNILETQGQDAYNKAADIYTQAPKLFGSMTSDQINQYLKPLQNQFDTASQTTQGAANARGLTGSSLEAQAMALAQKQFQEGVLSTGLQVGQQQQQNQSNVLQGLGSQLFGAGQQQYGLAPQYAGLANNLTGQNTQIAEGVSGLPGSAVNLSLAQQAAIRAMNPKSQSFLGGIASGLESAVQQDVVNLGQNAIQTILPGTAPGMNGPNMLQQLMASGRTPTGAPGGGGAGGGLGGGSSYAGWSPGGNPALNLVGGLQQAGPVALAA